MALDDLETQRPTHVGEYLIGKTIGRGTSSTVKLGVHKITQKKVALKFMGNPKRSKEVALLIQKEIDINRKLDHPNIAKLLEVIEPQQSNGTCLVFEYVPGELFRYIVEKKKLSESLASKLFGQVVSAVEYCHQLGIIHRDLKPENMMLDAEGNIKIIDFGLAAIAKPGILFSNHCGSPAYASPEMLRGRPYAGPEVDIWAMGVALFTMVTGCLPWEGQDLSFQQVSSVLEGKITFPGYLSQECCLLLEQMLTVNVAFRATIAQIKRSPWLNGGKPVVPRSPPLRSSRPSRSISAVDQDILAHMESLGFEKDEVVKDIVEKNFMQQTYITYQRLVMQNTAPAFLEKRTSSVVTPPGSPSNASKRPKNDSDTGCAHTT